MMPSASVAPAVASEEQGKARRILFCAFPLYGHVLPLSRIAAAFCGCPGFDVQFMIVADRMDADARAPRFAARTLVTIQR